MQGKGVATFSNGNVYEGDFVKGKIEGEGTLKSSNGDKYIGLWRSEKMHGTGTYFYGDGDKYEGEWQNDKRHGVGRVEYCGEGGEVQESYDGGETTAALYGHMFDSNNNTHLF